MYVHPVQTDNPFPGSDRGPESAGVSGAPVRVRDAMGYDDLLRRVAWAVGAGDRGLSPERVRPRLLPRYPDPASRPTPSLLVGETHLARTYGPASNRTWLKIPQRGLYTGVMILDAVGTGKTSAWM